MRYALGVLTAAVVLGLASGSARAQTGDDELAKAIELKLTAKSLSELGEVIQFCEGALSKGFADEADTLFCRQLLASTLFQRADVVSQALAQAQRPGAVAARQLAQLRQMAVSDLRRAVEQDPSLADAHLLLARLEAQPGGDRVRAREAAGQALELLADDPLQEAQALVLRADLQDDPAARQADYDRALELAPSDLEARRARGVFLTEQGKFSEALADLDQVLELDGSQASAFEARGIARLGLRQGEAALADLNRALELAPQSALARFHRARAQLFLGRPAEALTDIEAALAVAPDNLAGLLIRATAQRALNRPQEALADVNRILELRPELPQALRIRAEVLAGQGKFDEAIRDLEAIRKSAPDDVQTLLDLATLHSAAKHPAQGLELYNAVVELDPANLRARQARADALLGLGRPRDALADYEEVLKLQPENPGVLNNLAWLLSTSPDAALRNGPRALELATQAGQLTEFKMPHILSTLAAAYAETGDYAKAVEWSEKAVALAQPQGRESLERELASYRQGKPWREQVEPPAATPETPATDGTSSPPAGPNDEAPNVEIPPTAEMP